MKLTTFGMVQLEIVQLERIQTTKKILQKKYTTKDVEAPKLQKRNIGPKKGNAMKRNCLMGDRN